MTTLPARLFTERRQALFLSAIRNGQTIRAAAARAGVNHSTIYDHMSNDPTFADAVSRARGEAEARLLDSITKSAHTGEVVTTPAGQVTVRPGDWKAAAWLLEHHPHTRERYATLSKVQHGGDPDNPAPILTETNDVGPATAERLGAVLALLVRAGKIRYPDPGELIIDADMADTGEPPVDAPDEPEGTL